MLCCCPGCFTCTDLFFFNNQRCTSSGFVAPGLTLTSKDSMCSVTRQGKGHPALPFCSCVAVDGGSAIPARFAQHIPSKNNHESCFQKMSPGFARGVLSIAHFSPLCLTVVASSESWFSAQFRSPHLPCGFGQITSHPRASVSSCAPWTCTRWSLD